MADDYVYKQIVVPLVPFLSEGSDISRMRARLDELELLYAQRFKHQVPRHTSELEEKHGYQCGIHPHIKVSEKTATVVCAICGEALDPLDVLRQFVRRERHFAYDLEHLRQEQESLTKEVTELKVVRSRLRSDIKRRQKGKEAPEG